MYIFNHYRTIAIENEGLFYHVIIVYFLYRILSGKEKLRLFIDDAKEQPDLSERKFG